MNKLILLAMLALPGCAYSVHQVQVSDFQPYAPYSESNIVKGQGEQFVILWFTQDTSYVEKARQDLIRQCPSGTITGITTQMSTDLGFFSWTNRALMQGLCVKSVAMESSVPAPAKKAKQPRRPSQSDESAE